VPFFILPLDSETIRGGADQKSIALTIRIDAEYSRIKQERMPTLVTTCCDKRRYVSLSYSRFQTPTECWLLIRSARQLLSRIRFETTEISY
jgi:hypothetical protein